MSEKNNKLINVVVDLRKWVEMSLVLEMMPQLAGLSIFPQIELDEHLDDLVNGIYQLIIDDLITPLLKSDNLSKSFEEIYLLYSMRARYNEFHARKHLLRFMSWDM